MKTATKSFSTFRENQAQTDFILQLVIMALIFILVVVPFTRDYDAIRVKLPHIEDGDKTCIEQALQGVNQLVLNEWGSQNPVQIIMVSLILKKVFLQVLGSLQSM